MSQVQKNKSFYLLSIIIAIFIRVLYFFQNPIILVSSDTYGYYEVGGQMLADQFFVHPSRPPVYPIFLNLPLYLTGNLKAPILSTEFYQGMFIVILIQSIIGIFSLIILYHTLLLLGAATTYAYLFSLFMTVNIMLFGWEKLLMAESLTIFWLIATTFVLIKTLKRKRISYFILLYFTFTFGFLLKPAYAVFPLAVLPVISLYYRSKKIIFACLFLLFIFMIGPWFYVRFNYLRYGYLGISTVGEINLLGKILQFNLSVENAKEVESFYKNVTHYRSIRGNPIPYRFLEYYYPNLPLLKNYTFFDQLGRFNFKVLSDNILEYLTKSIAQLPAALLDTSELIFLFPPNKNAVSFFFNLLFFFYKALQWTTLIILPFYPITLYQFLKKPTLPLATLSMMGTISMFQILSSVLFSYGEFGRLISVAQPQLYLFSFYWWGYLINNKLRKVVNSLLKHQIPIPPKRKTKGYPGKEYLSSTKELVSS